MIFLQTLSVNKCRQQNPIIQIFSYANNIGNYLPVLGIQGMLGQEYDALPEQPRSTFRMPDSAWSKIRGFNYQPSYAAHGLDVWRRFDAAKIEREISLGKKYFPKINTLRLWLSWEAYLADPRDFAGNFETMLAILNRSGLRAIVTLLNAWHSIPDFGGLSTPS